MHQIDVRMSKKLVERQWGQCALCGIRLYSKDKRLAHKINERQDKPENFVVVCKPCTKKVEKTIKYAKIAAPSAWKHFPYYNGPRS